MAKIKSLLISLIPYILIVAFVLLFFRYVIMIAYIPSGSMEHTLDTGDSVIFNRLAYLKDDPKRGDIIAFYSDELEDILCKRVIGIPGDEITIDGNSVTINGVLQKEKYIQKDFSSEPYENTFKVPKNCVFLLGDNRPVSFDARYWENPYIQKQKIMGRYIVTLPGFIGKIQGVFIKMRTPS